MSILSPLDSVVVSRESFESEEPWAIVGSNIDFVNALLGELLRAEEISLDAWRSYYVDYYLSQVENGGFSQFVYNTRWNAEVVTWVKQGLQAMGATHHLALFEEGAALVDSFGEKLEEYLDSDYFGENEDRDQFETLSDRFYEINESEDLQSFNAQWLKARPGLQVLSEEDYTQAIATRAQAITDLPQRQAEQRENEPGWLKSMRALCAAAGHELDRPTAGDFFEYEGQNVFAHHFLTNQGHHFMLEFEGKAILFNGTTSKKLAEIDAVA